MKKPMIIITGPTAAGKTKASIALAKEIKGEIISADSMQVYRSMDIGTAKPTQEEMGGIPHWMIDEIDPDEEFNVMIFQKMAKTYYEQILERGNMPIIVGGTGFYLQSVIYNIQFTQTNEDDTYRKQLEEIAAQGKKETLHRMLEAVDPDSAKIIHMNNIKKVIRALEYYEHAKEPISVHNEREKQRKSPYQLVYIVFSMDRQELYHRIDRRVDLMIKGGLVEEVERLLAKGYSTEIVSMQGLGYKEIAGYLQGQYSLEEAIYILKRDTRRFAKRQLTWFRRESNAIWLDISKYLYNTEKITTKIKNIIEENGIII